MTQSCDEECKMKFRNPPMLDERLMGSLGFFVEFLGYPGHDKQNSAKTSYMTEICS
jgi:hypothetical protein